MIGEENGCLGESVDHSRDLLTLETISMDQSTADYEMKVKYLGITQRFQVR